MNAGCDFDDLLENQGNNCCQRQQRCGRKGRGKVVSVVEHLHFERLRGGLTADVAGDHLDRAKLADGARGREYRSIERRSHSRGDQCNAIRSHQARSRDCVRKCTKS